MKIRFKSPLIACMVLLIMLRYAAALELESNSYTLSRISFNNGGAAVSSLNFILESISIGEGAVGTGELSGISFITRGGETYLLTLREVYERRKLLVDFRARADMLGSIILENTWQQDDDPYFYWSLLPGVSPELIKGYSLSLDQPPDTEIETSETSYQFPDDYITSGKHIVYLLPILIDGSADYDEQLEFNLWVDIDAPLVSQLQPIADLLVSDNRTPITCLVTDQHSGFDQTLSSLRINGSNVYFQYDADTQTLTYVPTALSEGLNSVWLKAYDLAGNYVVKAWDFVVDTQHPTGAILINNGERVTHLAYVFINLRVEDVISGVKEVFLSNDGIFDTEMAKAYPYAPVIYNWLLAEPDVDGTKTVYAKFRDAGGNISETYMDSIELRRLTPDTRIISGPLSLTEETGATFKFEATKPNCVFSYKLDQGDWSSWSASNEASFSGLSEGNHYFYVKSAIDLSAEGEIGVDEEDATPAQWVWTVRSREVLEKMKRRILFWRR